MTITCDGVFLDPNIAKKKKNNTKKCHPQEGGHEGSILFGAECSSHGTWSNSAAPTSMQQRFWPRIKGLTAWGVFALVFPVAYQSVSSLSGHRGEQQCVWRGAEGPWASHYSPFCPLHACDGPLHDRVYESGALRLRMAGWVLSHRTSVYIVILFLS